MNRTYRLELIEQILLNHPDGLRAVEISALCDVDRRTIYRDLEYMQAKGLPLWQEHGKFGIARESYLAHLRINANEAAILVWAVRFLSHHLKPRNPHVVSLLRKIVAALPPELNGTIAALGNQPGLTSSPHPQIKVIEAMTAAWIEGIHTEIWYMNAAKPRIFGPYVIDINAKGQLYAIGYDHQTEQIRPFKLHNIARARNLPDKPVTIPDNFDVALYLKAAQAHAAEPASETVVLRLHPRVVQHINGQKWYSHFHLEYLENGHCLMVAEVVDGREMEIWIQDAGRYVEVIAPQKLRKNFPAPIG